MSKALGYWISGTLLVWATACAGEAPADTDSSEGDFGRSPQVAEIPREVRKLQTPLENASVFDPAAAESAGSVGVEVNLLDWSDVKCTLIKTADLSYPLLKELWQKAANEGIFTSEDECRTTAKMGYRAVSFLCDALHLTVIGGIACTAFNYVGREENYCFCAEISYPQEKSGCRKGTQWCKFTQSCLAPTACIPRCDGPGELYCSITNRCYEKATETCGCMSNAQCGTGELCVDHRCISNAR